ncbi:MAG: DNA-binding protein [Acidimicrobiia bacterium]|nr:DNA-binding protein [Acidimicrobiia bacterium]
MAEWKRRREAAAHIRTTSPTLAYWATLGIGPPFRKVGKHCLYNTDDLDAWVEAQPQGGEVKAG